MSDMTNAVRVNSRISKEINDWLDSQSKETGIPKSSIIYLALEQYMHQKKAFSNMDNMQLLLTEMNENFKKLEEKLQ